MRRQLLLFALALSCTLHGQARAQALPRWSLDLVAGNGRHPTQVGQEFFFADARVSGRATLTWRLVGLPTTSLDALLQGESSLQFSTGEVASCASTPSGIGCVHSFPPPSGLGLGVGVRQAIGSRLQLRGATGLGHILSSHGSARPFVEADAAFRLTRHMALVGGTRYMWWTQGGYAAWFAPTTWGLRLF